VSAWSVPKNKKLRLATANRTRVIIVIDPVKISSHLVWSPCKIWLCVHLGGPKNFGNAGAPTPWGAVWLTHRNMLLPRVLSHQIPRCFRPKGVGRGPRKFYGRWGPPRPTKFGVVTGVGEGRVSTGSSTISILKGVGLQRLQFFRSPTWAHTVWHTETTFCIVIKLAERIIYTGSTTLLALDKLICDARSLFGS